MSSAERDVVARKLMPATASAGSSAGGQTALSASGMVFEKAGTFTGDLSGIRATQSRFSARVQRDFSVLNSSMPFRDMAENLSVQPIAFRTMSRVSYGMIEGAQPSAYEKFTPGEVTGWAQGNVTYNKLETVGSVLGSTTQGATIVGAVEKALTDDVSLGVMYSKTESESTVTEDAGSIKNKQNQFGFYGQKLLGDVKVTGVFTHGQNSYDSARKVSVGGVTEYALAKYDGTTTQFSLGVSKKFDYEGLTLEPFGLASSVINKSDGFSETGASSYGLTVGATTSRDFAVTLGTVITRDLVVGGYPAQLKLKPAFRFNNQIAAGDATIARGVINGVSAGRESDFTTALFTAAVDIKQSKTRTLKFGTDLEQSSSARFGKLFMQYDVKF